MESSTVVAFRALVMLACLVVVPLAAVFGSAFPDLVKSLIVDRFAPEAAALRHAFDARLADPKRATADRFVWDYWHIPDQYTLLRTPAHQFFPRAHYRKFHERLVWWGRRTLGCHDVSMPWLSLYVEGCRQELHADLPHGPWAFVFSLTPRQVEEICAFREVVEVSAVKFAMEPGRPGLVEALRVNVRETAIARKTRDWKAMRQLDEAFHEAIVDHCGNAYLKQAHQLIASKIGALRARLPEEAEQVDHCQQNHATILALLREGRVAATQRALALHIRDTLASYRAASNLAETADAAPLPRGDRR
jgi:DNA-binding FadR family transcriptional regulator